MLGGDAEAKAPDASTETKPELVDDKWEPAKVEGLTRDPADFGAARTAFKEAGLTKAQAQKMVELSDKLAKVATENQAKAAEKWLADRRADHLAEIQKDPKLGGANFKKTQETARSAVKALGGPELAKTLVEAGLDNHPVIVRAFEKAGRLMAEDTVNGTVTDGGVAVGDPAERALRATYPSMFKKES